MTVEVAEAPVSTLISQPNRAGIIRQYLAAAIASIAVFCDGNIYGWIPPLLLKFHEYTEDGGNTTGNYEDVVIRMTNDESSWVISIISVGNILAPIPCSYLMDLLGRKPVILANAPLFVLAWLLAVISPTLYTLYAVRIIQGIAAGCIFMAVPVYIGEVGHASVRGAMTLLVPAVWTIGVMYEYITVPYLSYNAIAYTSCIFPVVFLVAFWWFPESPHFLLMKGRSVQAAKSMAWFRGATSNDEISEELGATKTEIYRRLDSNKAGWRQLFCSKRGLKSFFIMQGLTCSSFLGGAIILLMYSVAMFPSSSAREVNVGSVIMCLITLGAEFLAALFIDRLGRRPLIVSSYLGTAAINLASAAIYYVLPPSSQAMFSASSFNSSAALQPESYSELSPLFVQLAPYFVLLPANFLLSIQIASVLTTVRVELFPTESRALSSAIISITRSFLFLVTVKTFQRVNDNQGLYVNFLIFSVFHTIGALLSYYFLPETKNKTFDDIQKSIR